MRWFLAVTAIFIATGANAQTNESPKAKACEAFSTVVSKNESDLRRLKFSVVAINESYSLGYDSVELAKLIFRLKTKLDAGQLSLDGVERVALFGCTNEMTAEDSKTAKAQFDSILAGN